LKNLTNIKVAVIELYNHSEIVLKYISLLQKSGATVLLFTNGNVEQHVRRMNHEKLPELFPVKYGTVSDLGTYLNEINRCDHILCTSFEAGFEDFNKIDFKVPVTVMLHNGNYFFSKPFQNLCGISGLAKYIYRLVKGDLRGKNKWKKNVNQFAFGDKNVVNHMIRVVPEEILSKIRYLPFRAASNVLTQPSEEASTMKIVIPGTIQQRTRDYLPLLEAMERLQGDDFGKKIIFQFAGYPKGKKGLEIAIKLKSLNSDSFTIEIASSEMDFLSFEKTLSEGNFFILPLQKSSCFSFSREEHGRSYISGTIYDLIEFQKPAIISDGHPIPSALQKAVEPYNNAEHMYILLKDWIENESFKKLNLAKIKEEFCLEKVTEEIQKVLFPGDSQSPGKNASLK
jgi:hypothetical protein